MKIVIVDDDVAMRQVLRAICESEGHVVTAEFGDGGGLLKHVTEHHPDVVCLDQNLPGVNGLDLLVHMDVTVNHVDVIMVTGSDDPELKGHAADLGATGFIKKPFEQIQIIDELKAIAQTRGIAARAAAVPADPVLPPPLTPIPAVPQKAGAIVPRTAIVVDDSGSIRYLLKGILEEMGVKVIAFATNGKDAIEAVKRMPPAMVCLDVDMPVMSGLEALPQIMSASPKTKVVMVTGNAGRPIVEAAISGGAKGYMLKPVRPAQVEAFVKKLLAL
jgi:CheY-like chemotaxis protein